MSLSHKTRIFIDIDGVLADFRSQAKYWGYEKRMENGKMCRDPELWKIINKDPYYFAASMDWEKYGEELYAKLICLFLPVIPITHYPSDEWMRGRILWLECNLPWSEKPILVPTGNSKATFCDGKSDILIDDMPANIEEWRLKGGTAVLWDSEKPEESFANLNLAFENLGVGK
jgi:5'(3')-deoxyribonucleotidase